MFTTATTTITGVHAALVHVERTHPEGSPLRRVRLDGSWPLRQQAAASVAGYLDPIEVLLAVAYRTTSGLRRLEVIDARQVTGWTLNAEGRVDFTTAAAPWLRALVGTPSPRTWTSGDGWPVKTLDLSLSTLISVPALAA